jgi:DNA-binding transcriptional LysR family regulator
VNATIDLNRAAVFVRVASSGSFTAAARALGTPVSSVSRSVASLEAALGVRLLHRTTRKLSLTDAGDRYFRRMQAVIAEADEAARAVTGFASVPKGLVRITAPVGFVGLAEVIARIARKLPEVRIELVLSGRIVDIVAEGIDLALRAGILDDSSLVARRLGKSELALYAAPEYLAQNGRPRVPRDLKKHACLRYRARSAYLSWRLVSARGEETVSVSGQLSCDDMLFLRDLALRGMGIALMPTTVVVDALAAGKLERVLPKWSFPGGGNYVVWPSQTLVPAHVVAVREMLIEELGRLFEELG